MGTKQLDESGAMPLACSRFITARFIDGGGVRYAENEIGRASCRERV
jgi:hypothetical protein